jgi:hypothetical protein
MKTLPVAQAGGVSFFSSSRACLALAARAAASAKDQNGEAVAADASVPAGVFTGWVA